MICFICQSPVMAKTKTYITESVNNVSIGDINIELFEYTLNKDLNEIPMPYKSFVKPGDDLPQIVRIKNVANDAWVRIKLDFQSDNNMKGLSDDLITLASDEWQKIGDYYYALKPMKHGTYVDFMKSIHIPEYWTEAYSGMEFRIIVTADAVQMQNFVPDFNSDDPWFGTAIEQCVHDVYEIPVIPEGQQFSIEFRGGAEGFIRVGDDFFSNWAEMMPGDTVTDNIQIRNKYKSGIKLYFTAQNLSGSKLLDQLDIRILCDEHIIYEGKMKDLERSLIAEYPTNTEGIIQYEVHVPSELTNEYALEKGKVKWIFETEIDESINKSLQNTSEKEKTPENVIEKTAENTPEESLRQVQTGDREYGIYVFLCFIAITILFYASKKKKT